MPKKTILNTKQVAKEFDNRALTRKGIDKVLSDRFSTKINKQFDKNCITFITKNFPNQINNILDVGVGIGRLTKYFVKKTNKLIGVDFSKNMLSIAKKYITNKDNVELINKNIIDLKFSTKQFDLGIISLVLKHNNDKDTIKIIQKMKKWCKQILIIEHVAGGSSGTDIAIIRTKTWYINHFKPMKPIIKHEIKRDKDNIILYIFQ